MRNYLEVLNAAFAGPGPVDVENDDYRVHNPLDVTDIVPTPILLAALAPVMLRIAGELASGTILWMADERAIGEHVAPAHHEGGGGGRAGRRRASWPASRSRCAANDEVDAARAWANQALGHAEYSPNYQRLLEHGDATDVGDLLAAGDESAVVDRLRSFRDAGVTDLAVRVLPLGTRSRRADRVARPDARVPRVAVSRALIAAPAGSAQVRLGRTAPAHDHAS